MSEPIPEAMRVGGVVLDIEGTTTPVSFVYDVLFPYARAHLREYLREHWENAQVREAQRLLAIEHAEDAARGEQPPPLSSGAGLDALAAYLEWLMDRDRKSPGLKLLQGHVWQRGFEDGTLRGEVYPDVPRALERWRAGGRSISIYSSGSVLGQRLLFSYSTAGDLTSHIDHYFDTGVGPKRSADSYRRIARALGVPSESLLFVSDVPAELDAAQAAGFHTRLCVRGDVAAPASGAEVIRSFDELA